jgi:LmbE family N-acetylglucosaminyl deacetylase
MRQALHRAARWTYRWLLPERAKNSLRQRLLFEERDRPPLPIERFDTGPVLVLAPHMDDEVLGCGGALRRHAQAGVPITVVFLTDGAADPAVPSSLRRAESQAAAALLGITRLEFLDAPDGHLETTPALVTRLAEILASAPFQWVYLPSLLDSHADHWVANLLLGACLERLGPNCRLRQYEVWSALVPNRLVDISAVWECKRRALECFVSQRAKLDLLRIAEGLAWYRSAQLDGGRGFAEAFFEVSAPEFRLLLERTGAARRSRRR